MNQLTDFKSGDRIRHARSLATGTVLGFRLGAFVCVRWDNGEEGDYYPQGLRRHDDRHPPVDLSKVPKAHLVIPHADFDATMLSNDCKTYFVDGFGPLEIRGNSMDGVVLEYHDHCGDGKLLPEWDRSKPAQADGCEEHCETCHELAAYCQCETYCLWCGDYFPANRVCSVCKSCDCECCEDCCASCSICGGNPCECL